MERFDEVVMSGDYHRVAELFDSKEYRVDHRAYLYCGEECLGYLNTGKYGRGLNENIAGHIAWAVYCAASKYGMERFLRECEAKRAKIL